MVRSVVEEFAEERGDHRREVVEDLDINKGVSMSGKKTAVVTGAQQGIGAGLVEGFLNRSL